MTVSAMNPGTATEAAKAAGSSTEDRARIEEPAFPRVSVVMPVHNTARYVAAAIESVLQQKLREIELILVDDGSTDDSLVRIRKFADPRITVLTNPAAGGPSRARNQAIRAAKAPYIAFLDSDDVMCVDSLLSAVHALDATPSAVIVFGDLQRIDLEGRPYIASVLSGYSVLQGLPKRALDGCWHVIARSDFARGLLYENFIGTGSVVVRSSALARTGLFDEALYNSEDRDLWFRLAREGDALFSSAIRYQYRLNPASVSHRVGEHNARNRITVLKRERKRWTDPEALEQIDTLIADNLGAVGYACRAEGRRLAAAASFAHALRFKPSWLFAKGVVGSLIGRRQE
jgi:glycosyltransferase involved in cell wall biosynthesis